MISPLEETKQKIKNLLDKYGFSTRWVSFNPRETDKIQVVSERGDTPEGEGIIMTISQPSGQRWRILDHGKGHWFEDEEEMLEFIDIELQDLVKGCG